MEALRIITEEHQNLWRIAITLDQVADEVDAGGKVDPAFFGSIFDYIEQFMDGCHHAKEDSYLFPALRQRSADAAAVLDRLQAEHRNGPQVLADLRAKLASTAAGGEGNAAFIEALRIYTQSIKAHIRTEEKDAMPLAREVLTADDWAGIDRAFLDN
ncbi:MAG: ABC transporter, partial [Dechloromonas sp.]